MSSGIKRQINIIGTIATTLIICVSGVGTYAFKGFLSEFKKEILEELRVESEIRLRSEFEALKLFLRDDLKKDIERANSESKEMVSELESLLLKERFKIKNALREEIEKCFGLLKNFEEGSYEK
ncbi:hypothetical protein [Borrelia hermsii]|uniref:Uncharacterized protein n=2 Tax=Borrelia hermsii TaxID=140 RepID=A0AAN0X7E9_BORHE|nr:hypothetical protein [Borrelia hermsii]AMR76140.1 hypothetical protein A0V01_05995 [Borrelia hermsii]ANA43994.1 hypothetical protein AXX13_G06 [Borrelia hermsii HS1]UPA08665.1 hypothetical protein bhDAH_001391 [Borrelia hermsii DAH]